MNSHIKSFCKYIYKYLIVFILSIILAQLTLSIFQYYNYKNCLSTLDRQKVLVCMDNYEWGEESLNYLRKRQKDISLNNELRTSELLERYLNILNNTNFGRVEDYQFILRESEKCIAYDKGCKEIYSNLIKNKLTFK